MATKEVAFSEARRELTSLLDEIEGSGKAIMIMRRGKPAAVLISPESFKTRFGKSESKRWSLKGSIKAAPGVDLEAAIEGQHRENIRTWKRRLNKWDQANRND